jgi:hypothetical protein
MPYKNKEDRAIRDKERYVKNRGYKKANHKGFFDGLANKAEEASSFLTRTKSPPNFTLNRVLGLAEQAQMYNATTEWEKRLSHDDFEASRNRCLDRIWSSYQIVMEQEVMYDSTVDESWGNAKVLEGTKDKFTNEPISYYGDALESKIAAETHGDKANGIVDTKIKEDI